MKKVIFGIVLGVLLKCLMFGVGEHSLQNHFMTCMKQQPQPTSQEQYINSLVTCETPNQIEKILLWRVSF